MDYSPTELMTIAAARALSNDDVCFVGIGAPSTACNLARLTHAPDITLIYESGTIATRPDTLPLSIGDPELSETALTTVSVPEMFAYWLQGGGSRSAFSAARRSIASATSTRRSLARTRIRRCACPAPEARPRSPAPVAASSSSCPSRRASFVPAVDFITSFGHGKGGDERQRLGLSTAGTSLVFTDLCVMRPHPQTKELEVISDPPRRHRRADCSGDEMGDHDSRTMSRRPHHRRRWNLPRCVTCWRAPRKRMAAETLIDLNESSRSSGSLES